MAYGPGDIDIRKVQLTGGSTYTLSLPKPWVDEMGLSPRDGVRVDWRPSGALRLSSISKSDKQQKRVSIDADSLPVDSLHDHLMGAYLAGVDHIIIKFLSTSERKFRKQIRRFLRNTRGFEIMEESESSVELLCLLNAAEMPLNASINRMYSQLSSLVRDIASVIDGDEITLLEDADERESEVDALSYLVERQVSIALDMHVVATSLKLGRNQAVEYSNLARALERMMDHALIMANLVKTAESTNVELSKPPITQLPVWQQAIKQLMINIRVRNSHEIEESRHLLKAAQNNLTQYEEELMKNKKFARSTLLDFKISESIRRLCAYARDFGEILLNIKLYDEMIIER
ncbi:MAG: phosphate uptake regulator PhoU [Candidatus Poseidoniaceae archaeon]|jgi:phosphate uptake regulator|nr:phosphate uptake regulator PhoU [Candidatus Poseidoniaceae archaeon]